MEGIWRRGREGTRASQVWSGGWRDGGINDDRVAARVQPSPAYRRWAPPLGLESYTTAHPSAAAIEMPVSSPMRWQRSPTALGGRSREVGLCVPQSGRARHLYQAPRPCDSGTAPTLGRATAPKTLLRTPLRRGDTVQNPDRKPGLAAVPYTTRTNRSSVAMWSCDSVRTLQVL